MRVKMLDFNYKALTALLLVSLSTPVFSDQSCDGASVTTDDDDFIISDDEPSVLTHSVSDLSWARCAVGQTWNADDSTCDGTATRFTWQEALALSVSYELEDKTGWRLPNIKELASIVERSCVDPAASSSLFPETPSSNFWSASPNTGSSKSDEAWAVSFSNGRLDSNLKQQDFYVRMVRYAE